MPRKPILPGLLALLGILCRSLSPKPEGAPVRALLVTGGCCHDYEAQKAIITGGISEQTGLEIE